MADTVIGAYEGLIKTTSTMLWELKEQKAVNSVAEEEEYDKKYRETGVWFYDCRADYESYEFADGSGWSG